MSNKEATHKRRAIQYLTLRVTPTEASRSVMLRQTLKYWYASDGLRYSKNGGWTKNKYSSIYTWRLDLESIEEITSEV